MSIMVYLSGATLYTDCILVTGMLNGKDSEQYILPAEMCSGQWYIL